MKEPKMHRRALVGAGAAAVCIGIQSTAWAQGFPASSFGPLATADEVLAGIDLSGLTAVVTGCNSGIGFQTMRSLANAGAHVIGTARTREKGVAACNLVDGLTTPVELELSDFESVVACARNVASVSEEVDILICNAGAIFPGLQHSNGLEKHFVVNHLGHFLLTNLLMSQVLAAPQGRVVVVGSNIHKQAPVGGIQFDDLAGESWDYRYHHSKLANGLFSLHLAHLLRGSNATSNCAHPGGVRGTNILRNVSASSESYPKTPSQGAATQCYLAAHPDLVGVSGEYFADCRPAEQSAHQSDVYMAQRLLKVSEELTADYLPKPVLGIA